MSVASWFSVMCDDCAGVCGGAAAMQDSAKSARAHARGYGWIRRQHPTTGANVDLCPTCASAAQYHQQSTMSVQNQLDLFDAQLARYTGPHQTAEKAYWLYLRQLFITRLPTRPQPFAYYAPMFTEEFS